MAIYVNNGTTSTGTIIDSATITVSAQEAVDMMKNMSMIPIDSASVMTTTTTDITLNDTIGQISELLNNMKQDVIALKLRVYVLEDRISGQEAARLLQMYTSEDPDSRYLAEEIIEKFEDNEYSI